MWLLLSHAAALVALWLLTEADIRYNYQRIQADGAADSLRSVYHRQRLTVRSIAATLLAFGASCPAWGQRAAFGCSAFGLLLIMGGWYGYRFNSGLNKARGLAPWYVSFSPWSSKLDQYFARQTRKKWSAHTANMPEAAQLRFLQMKAGCALRNAMQMGLIVGAAAYLGCVGAAIALTL